MDHACEPTMWPSDLGERWTCPACGRDYFATTASNMPGPVIQRAVERGLMDPESLGWWSPPTLRPTPAQVAAAKLKIKCDEKLGRTTSPSVAAIANSR